MAYAQIAGWGKAAPSRVVSNDDLVQIGVETSDDWVVSRTGIKTRHFAATEESTSDLAVQAARAALEVANVPPADIDLIIVATCTPDHFLPATAALVQDRLGVTNAGALDVNAVCSGFVYGLSLASGYIEAGRSKRALVIGADTVSMFLDWKDRNTSILFGDGAGAVVLKASQEPGIMSTVLGSDGSGAPLLVVPGGGSRRPFNGDILQNGDHHLYMDGRQVFRWATQMMGKAVETVLKDSGLSTRDIDLLIPHQANMRIIESVAKRLGMPRERVFTNVSEYGNTSAASIPLALCEALEQGRVKAGDHIMLATFGAGLSWGAALIRWGLPLPVEVSAWSRWRRRMRTIWAWLRQVLRRRRWKARSLLDREL